MDIINYKALITGFSCVVCVALAGHVVAQTPQKQQTPKTSQESVKKVFKISGIVYDDNKTPVPKATIVEKNRPANGTVTDAKGAFELSVASPYASVVVSFVGMVGQTIEVNNQKKFNIYLKQEVNDIEATVVTGYFPKAKNSFTGTAVQVKGDELRSVNNVSFFDALKVFDPSFQVVDTKGVFGSDPNRIPDHIEIRGQNSFPDIAESNLKTVTSMPVFIMDGFEIKVQQVYDLDMNRIQSVTILKDASAAAIYGAKAANGVVVIETKDPEPGALRVSYSLTGGLNIPDLSSYNLMNAEQALEFQRLAGMFDAAKPGEDPGTYLNSYNMIQREIMSGVDTYWLSKPLRVGFQQRHSLFIEGSVNKLRANKSSVRYQVNISVGDNKGVMKGSGRTNYGGGTKLIYTRANLRITNDLQFAMTRSNESPYGSFSAYTKALPYHREKDAQGNYYRTLSLLNVSPEGGLDLANTFSQSSPVYEAKYLSSFTAGDLMNFSNKTAFDWTIISGLKVKGDVSIQSDLARSDIFLSPMSYSYIQDNQSDINSPSVLYDRGKYKLSNETETSVAGKLVVSYTKNLGNHLIQAILGGDIKEMQINKDNYTVTGFMDDALDYLSYATQYEMFARPMGSESTVRSVGVFSNINYSYDGRYLVDVTGRLDGSSVYGRNRQTAPYWSTGVRWNIHNEQFLKNTGIFDNLALRANIGTTGNQNFTLNQAMSLYTYLKPTYGNLFGTYISTLGNPDLEPQTTFNRNIGLEMTILKGMLNIDMNYYYNTTKGSLTTITIAPSIGFSDFKVNQGDIVNEGVEFNLTVAPIRTRDVTLSFSLRGRHNSNTLSRISNTLKNYNEMVGERVNENNNANVFLFEEGQSMNTIYAVRSLGINPGTGREEFLTKDGQRSDVWSSGDLVPVGIGEPVVEGYTGFNMRYRAWDFGADFNYSIGADRYNHTLHEKIEGVTYTNNNDLRALTERWQKPGDVAKYKAIGDDTPTKATSRFVQKENRFSLTSLRVSYTMPVERMGIKSISMLRFSVTANDIFYLSTIKQERGLDYPFARTVNFAAQINF